MMGEVVWEVCGNFYYVSDVNHNFSLSPPLSLSLPPPLQVPFFLVWSVLNSVAWAYQSTQALPFTTILLLMIVWAFGEEHTHTHTHTHTHAHTHTPHTHTHTHTQLHLVDISIALGSTQLAFLSLCLGGYLGRTLLSNLMLPVVPRT